MMYITYHRYRWKRLPLREHELAVEVIDIVIVRLGLKFTNDISIDCPAATYAPSIRFNWSGFPTDLLAWFTIERYVFRSKILIPFILDCKTFLHPAVVTTRIIFPLPPIHRSNDR